MQVLSGNGKGTGTAGCRKGESERETRFKDVRVMRLRILIYAATICFCVACSTSRKLRDIQKDRLSAEISMVNEAEDRQTDEIKDTVIANGDSDDGRTGSNEPIIMNAVKDENGIMVAHDVIQEATVTARFRNVAERHGMVNLESQIHVPADLMDEGWQLRFYPEMFILEDTVSLDPVFITGRDYRNEQMRGYNRYERFLKTIITDSSEFVRTKLLETFIERNIPELYAFKNDSSFVSDREFASAFGVTGQEAADHYTRNPSKAANERRRARMNEMYRKYVKVPIDGEGLRLDTVMNTNNGDFIYRYIQTIRTRPGLRKADLVLNGEIFRMDERIYTIPSTEPLTYYISSLSAFVDPTERYMTKVIERRVEENTACYIEFEHNSSIVTESLGHNYSEIGRIKGNLAALIEDVEYDLDSIVVTASSSPEGTLSYNRRLTQKRSEAVAEYFKSFINDYCDSLALERGFNISMDEEYIEFIAKNNAENWEMLDALIASDSTISYEDKIAYIDSYETDDLDEREMRLQKLDCYRHLRESLYPKLRTVKFDFHLHRKGMVKDTVHTTVIDSAYMSGVQAIRDRDYKKAIKLLRPYQDYNTAVAFCAMDYNASALAILERLERDARVNYLLAILYSRRGDERKALMCYQKACEEEPSYVHRGNLDPEISSLLNDFDQL